MDQLQLPESMFEDLSGPQARLKVNERLRWRSLVATQPAVVGVFARARVHNAWDEPLHLSVRIMTSMPWESHFGLVWGERPDQVVLRRLDQGAAAISGTWHGGPPLGAVGVSGGVSGAPDHRRAFEKFCADCHIVIGPAFRWVEAKVPNADRGTLWVDP